MAKLKCIESFEIREAREGRIETEGTHAVEPLEQMHDTNLHPAQTLGAAAINKIDLPEDRDDLSESDAEYQEQPYKK